MIQKKKDEGVRRKQIRGEGEKKEPQEEKGGNAKKEVNFEGDFFVLKAVSKYIFTLLFCCIFPRCAFFFHSSSRGCKDFTKKYPHKKAEE